MAENVQTMWNKVQICANTNTVQNNKNAKYKTNRYCAYKTEIKLILH